MSKISLLKKEELFQIPVPKGTATYVPISNKGLISTVDARLSDYGFKVCSEQFQTAESGQIMIAKYGIQSENDEIAMMLAFGNSYNKTRKVSIAAGGQVIICCNGMVKGDFVSMRKHNGSISYDLNSLIEDAIQSMGIKHSSLLEDTKQLKEYQFNNRKEFISLIGDMYFNHQFLNTVQLNIIKREIQYSEHFAMLTPNQLTAWNLYNNVTEALKVAHPTEYISSHKALHALMMDYVRPQKVENIDWDFALFQEASIEG
ncbi:MAG TPA: hypothetical protein DCL77_01680 [Prolixibacteraceae bacterium]|jgi:hypothetical protein|nr:hypothetical protein [Prolixibacteraceae bacterium]